MAESKHAQPDGEGNPDHQAAQLRDTRCQLQAAIEELEEERHFRDRFLATLVHDLRNPLASLRSGFSLLQRAKGGNDTLASQVSPLIDRQLSHLARLMEEMSDLAKARAGELVLRAEPFSLQSAAEAAARAAAPGLAAHELALHLALDGADTWVHGDSQRIAQVLATLLDEASRRANPGSSLSLVVCTWADRARVGIVECAAHAPPGAQEPLLQAPLPDDGRRLAPDLAAGLSLCLAGHLVELHGGRLWAGNRAHGRRGLWIAELPLAPATPSPAAD